MVQFSTTQGEKAHSIKKALSITQVHTNKSEENGKPQHRRAAELSHIIMTIKLELKIFQEVPPKAFLIKYNLEDNNFNLVVYGFKDFHALGSLPVFRVHFVPGSYGTDLKCPTL